MRALMFAAALVLLAGCASAPSALPAQRVVRIAADTSLTLPSPPGYPETRTLRQIVRARHGENDGAFEAVLALSPVRVEIVVIAPNGPRLATITWDETGVSEDRSALAPGAVPVESLLGDVFVSLWPRDMVAAALPVDVSVIDEADGGRTISRGGVALVEIRPNPADPTRRTLRNLGFGYELTIANLE